MPRIGFIGLGIMGRPMAANVVDAGYPLIVHNRSRGAVQELCARGATAAGSPGKLSIMCGGSDRAVDRARPIFDVLAKTTTHIGPPGAGQVTKAANQVVVALTIQAVAEALTPARHAGVDPARVREALLGGFAPSRILDLHGQRMLDGAFDPGFKLHLHRKDLAIALQLGREVQMPLLATGQAAGLMDALLAQGAGEQDHSALALVYERLSGLAELAPG
jgi:2-hydroxy-3-oxopropionate reductase